MDDTRRHVAEDRAPGAHTAAAADDHSGSHEYIGCQPCFCLDPDLPGVNVKGRIGVVGRASTDVGSLRDYGAVANLDLAQCVQNHLVSDVAEISDLELPRVGHSNGRPKDHTLADASPNDPQQPPPPTPPNLPRHS